jgi:hypothetical protein
MPSTTTRELTNAFPTKEELDVIESVVFATKNKAEELMIRLREINRLSQESPHESEPLEPITGEQAWMLQEFSRYLRYSGEDLVKYAAECVKLAEDIYFYGQEHEDHDLSNRPTTAQMLRDVAAEYEDRYEARADA